MPKAAARSRFGQDRDASTPPNWRPFAHPQVDTIEVSPVVILHNGLRSGGTLYRSGLRYAPAPHIKNVSRRPTEEKMLARVDLETKFQDIVDK